MTLEGVRIGVGSSIFGFGAEFAGWATVPAKADAGPKADGIDAPGFPAVGELF